ncbi:hypothetical protein [Streptomyces sp. NPDC056105]|uniref:hypothetical protein n=1 Tax=Streptomyces sp. NPDC056105 TaxID=3345714 RepID=UPI0035D5586E
MSARPDVAEDALPWFGGARFLGGVPEVLAEVCLQTADYGHDLSRDEMRMRFAPWLHATEVVSERSPGFA